MRWRMRFLSGPRQGDVLPLPSGVEQRIGREGDCGILIADEGISRHHATILWDGEQPVVVDLGSLNGLFVNGDQVKRAALSHWDLLVLAGSVVRIEQCSTATEKVERGALGGGQPLRGQMPSADLEQLLDVLFTIQGILSGDGEHLIERTLETLFSVLPATRLSLITVAADGSLIQGYTVTPDGSTEAYLGQGFARRVLEAGAALLMEDTAAVGDADWGRTIANQRVRSILGAPVRLGERVVGVLLCDNRERPGTLRQRHLRLVEFAARALAGVFHREQLAELAAARGELAAARRVQERLLGRDPSSLPGAVRWVVHFEPAASVAGDIYDWHRGVDRTTWVVADVSGHGVSAALVVSLVKAFLKTLYPLALTPAALLIRLNELLVGELPAAMFVTAVAVVVTDDGWLTVAGAGHPPVLVARGDGRIDSLPAGRGLIGMPPSWGFLREVSDHSLQLEGGDRIILYSDGLIEAGPVEDQFGGERLLRAVAATRHLPLDGVLRTVVAEMHRHGQVKDDLTLVLGEVQAVGNPHLPVEG